MEEYLNSIWFWIFLIFLGFARLVNWLRKRGQTSVVAPEGEGQARLPGIDEKPPEYALPLALKKAREKEVPTQAPLTVQPEEREAHLEEGREQPAEVPAVETLAEILETPAEDIEEQPAEVPAGETAPEIRKARRSPPAWLRDADDVKRAVIWAEVLRRPVPRHPRRRPPRNRAGPV